MKRRASGIVLHITSLPSPYGIGDLGADAYRFVDFLAEARQGFWQVLPLNPTRVEFGNSPYNTYSVFAGNPLLLSPLSLFEEGLLRERDVSSPPDFPQGRVDYRAATKYKGKLLESVYRRFREKKKEDYDFEEFCAQNHYWLRRYALFGALKKHFKNKLWSAWPRGLKEGEEGELSGWEERLGEDVEKEKVLQYLFFKQWHALKGYANGRGILVLGDLPIYVNYDSSDVWANPELFKLDAEKRPAAVAGVPPDYFSATGQLWGNPLYRWDFLKQTGYAWWIRRAAHNMKLFDVLRLDHFKAFNDYWEVPAGAKTAIKGRWLPGPGEDFFHTLLRHFPCLPFIAEDLGVITAEVRELRDKFDFPGMRVLQFAFSEGSGDNLFLPHTYVRNCVAYTGTHDNDTLMGWLQGEREEMSEESQRALRYIGVEDAGRKDVHWEFIRALMMSAANLVIIPMQDILGLGNEARMNHPGKSRGNWEWRLAPEGMGRDVGEKLKELTETYGRA